ncbi:heme ABC transporter ATP-binding protein [Nocardioides sp. zg-1228]|uniref:heme ABC transporter ATP-binding protein n=1 Tax=Nocardioides sp. zg-1228 TaxID=2763008 RepID=UPI0016427896|nr:heme ABC transporter ATP-binding protein [Nocardioides sp. zg-1228]MBC2933774.1 heme ABC transporter ATP-binding protein [Nocardioides sp. zg-1228]QSF58549.1 heme ABC transporter ATP-binding protein [Nocardioides sp. zg-1228]
MTAARHTTAEVGTAVASVRGVTTSFGTRRVLDDVDLDLHAGEVLALVGPNGTGKSTLLAVVAGDLEPERGAVTVHGRPVRQWRLQALARERAVLTQEQRVSFPFPVREVVEMGRAPWRGHPEEDLDDLEVAAAMQTTEVEHLAVRSFGSLSGGEKGRASFARVLAQQTGILMLDEPTAALDIGHQETLLATARRRAAAGAAVLVVLHDLTLAAAHADRMVLLEDGRVAAVGTPREVLDPALLTRVYRHRIEVVAHPRTGDPIVLADRRPAPALDDPLSQEDPC